MADVAVPSIATGTPIAGDHVLGDQGGVVKRFPASPPFAQLAATTGANLLGYSAAEVYDANTVGAAIKAIGTGGGSGDALVANPLSQFAATTSLQLKGVISDETGSGALVFATSPTLVTPALGTPASGVATNLTGTAAGLTAGNVTTNANLTGDVTSVGNASTLATVNSNVGSFTNANITVNAKGLVTAASNGVGGSGGGDALTTNPLSQFAATTSLQLAGVISDETGSGALVFATSPTLVTPALGTPASGVATNLTGTASGLTAGNVTTNANLTGDVTSVGNAATVVKINGTSLAGLATGILKNTTTTGVPSIAVAGDFPTLNQSTTGSAATLTTSRNIDGQAFNGSAAITVIAPGTHAATTKTTPVDADELPLVDSAAANVLAKLTWANLKATLKTYFDSLSTTLTNKTLTNPTITNYVETVFAPAAGSAFTVDWANGTNQVFTTNANITITLPSAVAGKSGTIDIIYGGAHTLTWAGGGTLRWPAGTAPTATSVSGKRDSFAFKSADATNTHGSTIGQNYAA